MANVARYQISVQYEGMEEGELDAIVDIAEEVLRHKLANQLRSNLSQSELLAVLGATFGQVAREAHLLNQMIYHNWEGDGADHLYLYRYALIDLAAAAQTVIEQFDRQLGEMQHDVHQDETKRMGEDRPDSKG